MRETGHPFDDVLADAQRLGYAEADPSFDVDGVDAAHKLAILPPSPSAIMSISRTCALRVCGMSRRWISALRRNSYRIKLLELQENERWRAAARSSLHVKAETPIGQVEGVFNAVVTEGSAVGTTLPAGVVPVPVRPRRL